MGEKPSAVLEVYKDQVRDYVRAFNSGNLKKLRSLFTPNALVYGVLGWGPVSKVEPIWKDLHECLSANLKIRCLVAENDFVAAQYSETGTSLKPFRGFPATGRSYKVVAMEFFSFEKGRIHRRWGARDSASIFSQLGFTK